MDGDLSLSQSFGGLRIANPDDEEEEDAASSPPPSALPHHQPHPDHEQSAARLPPFSDDAIDTNPPALLVPQPQFAPPPPPPPPPPPGAGVAATATADDSADRLPSTSPESTAKRLSIFNVLRRQESDGRISNSGSPTPTPPPPTSAPTTHAPSGTPPPEQSRNAAAWHQRQSMPLSHQAQQQALTSPYGAIQSASPLQRGYNPSVTAAPSRPVSGVYAAHPPLNAQLDRQPGPYRLRSESSHSSMTGPLSRSDSRSAGTAMQAGVPTRENSHRDRTYNPNHQLPIGNGPLPPRRSSRGMADRGPSSGQPPYALNGAQNENGPLPSSEEWKEKGAAVAVRQEIDANGNPVLRTVKKGVKDFVFGRTLGEGSYSTVLAATDRQTLREYAVKILDKRHIIKEKKIKYVNIEKNTLNRLTEHPGIVRLYYTFQDEKSLYYVLDVASGGELLGVLKKIGTFDEECTRFYGAQILDAIEYMHSRGVIHRDLKPENLLLDEQMHVKITDFGTAKLLRDPRLPPKLDDGGMPDAEEDEDGRATSFVGTAEYVSPELLTDKNACKASDLWAFGCIIYQLLSGRPPFKGGNEYQTFQKIVGLEYEFPQGFPAAARDLVERLLVLDPQRRLSIEHIKNHEFFTGIKWGRSLWKLKAPRLKPYVPTQETNVIQLNGFSGPAPSGNRAGPQNSTTRPPPRVIYELPPPTQLDIEWAPVLTRSNERILKMGNQMVLTSPKSHSPNAKNGESEGHKMISRIFGGNTTKKRQRLVIVTSSGRIIMAASGDEKKSKGEISLVSTDSSWRTQTDPKGQPVWCVDNSSTHFTFEEPKGAVSTPEAAQASTEEWLESLERARDIAFSQNVLYGNDNMLGEMSSSVTSLASTLGPNNMYTDGFNATDRAGRSHLSKSQASLDDPNPSSKRKRFSKRTSKNGLGGAVF